MFCYVQHSGQAGYAVAGDAIKYYDLIDPEFALDCVAAGTSCLIDYEESFASWCALLLVGGLFCVVINGVRSRVARQRGGLPQGAGISCLISTWTEQPCSALLRSKDARTVVGGEGLFP